MAVPMKPEYGPTLGQLLAPRWQAASPWTQAGARGRGGAARGGGGPGPDPPERLRNDRAGASCRSCSKRTSDALRAAHARSQRFSAMCRSIAATPSRATPLIIREPFGHGCLARSLKPTYA